MNVPRSPPGFNPRRRYSRPMYCATLSSSGLGVSRPRIESSAMIPIRRRMSSGEIVSAARCTGACACKRSNRASKEPRRKEKGQKTNAPDRSPTRSGALVFCPFSFRRGSLLALLLLLQAQAPVQRAALTISPEDIRRRIGIIADDSMRGRDTPSPELDKVAQYIGREYRRLGLKPGGDRGTFIQRYSIDRVKIVADSSVAFVHGGGADITFSYGTNFAFVDNTFDSG